MATTHYNSGGIGFTGALTILFIALKLLDKIDWSWWWVLSPILISLGLNLLILLVIATIGVISGLLLCRGAVA